MGNGNEKQKSILATGTFIVTGAALYQATGNATYLSEAETAYAWVRANVFKPPVRRMLGEARVRTENVGTQGVFLFEETP